LQKELKQLAGISAAEAPYFWNGPVDLLFYRFLLGPDIRAHVRSQIAHALATSGAPGGGMPSCSFIGHSMGTAVLHDTLAELLSNATQFGGLASMDVQMYASVANVSRVMRSFADPHRSAVRPNGAVGDPATPAKIGAFVNVHHIADPVPHIGMFDPKWDPTKCFYIDVNVERMKWIDVHGLIHYLENPRVHIPILRTVLAADIDEATEAKAVKAYDARIGDKCPEALSALVDEVAILKKEWDDRGSGVGAVDVVMELVHVYKAFANARTACLGAGGGQP
jgi:hypothetical protein